MKTIQLHIPDELADKVLHVSNNIEKYIIDLLKANIKELKEPLSLAEQYKMAAEENAELMKEFAHIDLEGWEDEY